MKYRNVHRAVFDMRASFIPGAVWIFRFIHPKSLLFYFLFAGMKSLIGFLMKSSYTLCESAVCSTQKQNGFVWSFGCARSGGERYREREKVHADHHFEPQSRTSIGNIILLCDAEDTLHMLSLLAVSFSQQLLEVKRLQLHQPTAQTTAHVFNMGKWNEIRHDAF